MFHLDLRGFFLFLSPTSEAGNVKQFVEWFRGRCVHCHGWWQTHDAGSCLHQKRFSVVLYNAKISHLLLGPQQP